MSHKKISQKAVETVDTVNGDLGTEILKTTLQAVRRRRRTQRRNRIAAALLCLAALATLPFLPREKSIPQHPIKFVNDQGLDSQSTPVNPTPPPRHYVSVFSTAPNTSVPAFSSKDTPNIVENISDAELLELCARFGGGGIVNGTSGPRIVLASSLGNQ